MRFLNPDAIQESSQRFGNLAESIDEWEALELVNNELGTQLKTKTKHTAVIEPASGIASETYRHRIVTYNTSWGKHRV